MPPVAASPIAAAAAAIVAAAILSVSSASSGASILATGCRMHPAGRNRRLSTVANPDQLANDKMRRGELNPRIAAWEGVAGTARQGRPAPAFAPLPRAVPQARPRPTQSRYVLLRSSSALPFTSQARGASPRRSS